MYDSYYLNCDYLSYCNSWCKMVNDNFTIKSYYNLKQIMTRFGINSNLKYLILNNIDNKDIIDILKIYFLAKAITFIINKKNSNILLDKINQKNSIIHSSKSSLSNNALLNIRVDDILYSIQSILYPNEVLSINKSFVENLS